MWLLVPCLILLALLFGAGSIVGGVFWLLGGAWPWLLIGLGAWLFWHQDGRHYRRRRYARAPDLIGQPRRRSSPTSPPAPGSASLRKAELPIDIQVKVDQIQHKVEVLLGYADRFPPFSQDLHLVRQTASDYLPRTIDTFLSMNPDEVDKPMPTSGKTPRQELKEQLALL